MQVDLFRIQHFTYFKHKFCAFDAPRNRHFFSHFMGQQQRNADGGDVVLRTQFQYVANRENSEMTGCHVSIASWERKHSGFVWMEIGNCCKVLSFCLNVVWSRLGQWQSFWYDNSREKNLVFFVLRFSLYLFNFRKQSNMYCVVEWNYLQSERLMASVALLFCKLCHFRYS